MRMFLQNPQFSQVTKLLIFSFFIKLPLFAGPTLQSGTVARPDDSEGAALRTLESTEHVILEHEKLWLHITANILTLSGLLLFKRQAVFFIVVRTESYELTELAPNFLSLAFIYSTSRPANFPLDLLFFTCSYFKYLPNGFYQLFCWHQVSSL